MSCLVGNGSLFFFVVFDAEYGEDGWDGKHGKYAVDLFEYWSSFIFKNIYF
jgi:hypothetical protein